MLSLQKDQKMATKVLVSHSAKVKLVGLVPLLFDRFSGDINRQLPPLEKVYAEGENLVMPTMNLMSFLSAKSGDTAASLVVGAKVRNQVAGAALSYVTIEPAPNIPLTRNGKPLTVKTAGLEIVEHVARVKHGNQWVPQLKRRPQLNTPWELSMVVHLVENSVLDMDLLQEMFEVGGQVLGIGTFRHLYGRFDTVFEHIE
jgi:hypothetical protein